MKMPDEWWTSPTQSEETGRPVMVTGRDGMDEVIASGKYCDRVEITWLYEAAPDGMPSEETAALMEKVDDALRDALKKEKACVLTGIYTGDGERNWIVYTKNTRIFNSVLNRALAPFELLPLRLYAEKDPEWEEYRQMRDMTYIAPGDD